MFITSFYFCNTLVWWLYGFKQWVISIEVPRQLKGEGDNSFHVNQKTYNIIKWIGIVINATVCIPLGIFRYIVIIELANKVDDSQVNNKLNKDLHIEFILTISSVVLAIIAGLFLADALRRMQNSFKENHTFSTHKPAMFLHMIAVVVCQAALVVLLILINIEIKNSKATLGPDILKFLLCLTLCVSQLIFVYLLIQF